MTPETLELLKLKSQIAKLELETLRIEKKTPPNSSFLVLVSFILLCLTFWILSELDRRIEKLEPPKTEKR